MRAYAPLFFLWLAITVPVVGVGGYLYKNLHTVQTVTNTKVVVVTPTATPTATPSAVFKPVFKATVAPTVKGGVK